MSKFLKILFAIIIIVIIAFAGYMLGNYINSNGNGKTVNSKEVNRVVNSVINEINTAVKNAVTDNEIKNEATENKVVEDTKPQTSKDERQTAIDMAKEEWGEDDSVTFKIDEQNEKGQFVIQVVDKNTTNVVLEYFVDVNKNTIKQK